MAIQYEEMRDKSFINPYNFVGVNHKKTHREKLNKNNTDKNKDSYSGVINCRLITKTPLAIPDNDLVKEDNEHKTYPFMRNTNEELMIPGSSLRGVIRSVYETVTDSCFVTSDQKQRISKRAEVNDASAPGVLMYNNEEGKWELYSAERYLIIMDDSEYKPFGKYDNNDNYKKYSRSIFTQTAEDSEEKDHYCYGDKVYFSVGDEYRKKGRLVGTLVKSFRSATLGEKHINESEGYLYIGEIPRGEDDKTNKHFEGIFQCGDEPVEDIEISNSDIEDIKKLVKAYNDEGINKSKGNCEWYKGVTDALDNKKPVPIWYKITNGTNVVLSIAAVGRRFFKKNMGQLLGDKKPCGVSDKNEELSLCPACSLFGMAGTKSRGSKVRITDAVLDGEVKDAIYEKFVTLKELSGPNISYLPFYATYNSENNYKQVYSYDDNNVQIRGRKYYWHTTKKVYEASQGNKRNSTMELVREGKEFLFKVYFDSISEKQLNELKWVLTLGDNNPVSSLCHKIGHGKSIGLGSSKIVIDSISIRTFSSDGNYKVSTKDYRLSDGYEAISDNVTLLHTDELLTILDMSKTEKIDVLYPYVDGYKEGSKDNIRAPHQWFSNYKKSDKKHVLPCIKDIIDNPLYVIKVSNDGFANKKNNNDFEIDAEYTGVVKDYKNEKIAYIKIENQNKTIQIHIKCLRPRLEGNIKKKLNIGDKVTLIYRGLDNNNFHKWECRYN